MADRAPEAWFSRRIRRGLAALIALRLEGHPPADVVEATAQVWVTALWPYCRWREEVDSERIGEAFRLLALSATRWPSPAEFLRRLPARREVTPPCLPPLRITEQERLEFQAYLQDALKKIGWSI